MRVHRADFSVSGIRESKPLARTPTHEQSVPVICGLHFQRKDYANIMAYELGFNSKRVLNKGAVPSIQPSKDLLEDLRLRATISTGTGSSRVTKTRGREESDPYGK